MKAWINRQIAYLWCVKHTVKAYWRYTRELSKDRTEENMDYPLSNTPTEAIRMLLEMHDGQHVSNQNQLDFLMLCKREYEFRQRIAVTERK